MSGSWVEGTMSNVFYQLSDSHCLSSTHASPNLQNGDDNKCNYLTTGQWYTPALTQSGVNGVMRQVIIDGLAKTEMPVIIRPLADDELPQLSRLFFCNAVRGIMPMNGLTLLSGEVVGFG